MIRLNLIKPRALESFSFSRKDLVKIGAKAIDTVQKRCLRGVNVNDRSSKPLSQSYARKKQRMGQPPVRNEMFSGAMLGAMAIVEADQDHVTIGFTRRAEQVKAAKNQDRDPWFGLSRNDEAVVLNYADQLLRSKTR